MLAMVFCTRCKCEVADEDGWDDSIKSIVGDLAPVMLGEVEMLCCEGCDGLCPCHTFVGLMPTLGVCVGQAGVDAYHGLT